MRSLTGFRRALLRKEKASCRKDAVDPPLLCVDRAVLWRMRVGRLRSLLPHPRCAGILWWMRMDSARSSTSVMPGGLHAFLAAHAGRSPPTWWGNASTAWQRTMWPPAAPSRRAASAANKSAMWPRTANVPASRVLRGGVAAPLDGSCLRRTSLQRPTSGAGATRRALPLLLRRGRLLRVAPTPALHQSAQPRRWVARHHRKLAHGRISLGDILLGVRNSSLELYRVVRSCSKPRTLLRPLPWSCW